MPSPWISLCVLPILSIGACGEGRSQNPGDMVAISQTPVTSLPLPTLREGDRIVASRHIREANAMAVAGGAIDRTVLIGRNRSYGRMVSPRLQLGAGAALRTGLHIDRDLAAKGFKAIEAGAEAIAQDGEVHSETPPDAPAGTTLSPSDLASGAAFFMADACPAMLALKDDPNADAIVIPSRRDTVTSALRRGLIWLMAQADDLERVDQAAPNRLLYDALAYSSCGTLTGNAAAQKLSVRFVALALAQTRDNGVFVKKGGADTSYQAVSVRLAADLLMAGYAAPDAEDLKRAWYAGAIWLGSRVLSDGRIDSRGNTRTCSGGQAFLGTPKKVSATGVYGALIYAGELASSEALKRAAARLSAWAQANERGEPCFS